MKPSRSRARSSARAASSIPRRPAELRRTDPLSGPAAADRDAFKAAGCCDRNAGRAPSGRSPVDQASGGRSGAPVHVTCRSPAARDRLTWVASTGSAAAEPGGQATPADPCIRDARGEPGRVQDRLEQRQGEPGAGADRGDVRGDVPEPHDPAGGADPALELLRRRRRGLAGGESAPPGAGRGLHRALTLCHHPVAPPCRLSANHEGDSLIAAGPDPQRRRVYVAVLIVPQSLPGGPDAKFEGTGGTSSGALTGADHRTEAIPRPCRSRSLSSMVVRVLLNALLLLLVRSSGAPST